MTADRVFRVELFFVTCEIFRAETHDPRMSNDNTKTNSRERLGIFGCPGFVWLSNDGSEILHTEPPSEDFRVVYRDPSTEAQTPIEPDNQEQNGS
jgi:hypothetical protein